MNELGRRPDYRIMALDKDTEERGELGAGWLKEDGSIYLKFNPFVTVPVGGRFSVAAFPIDHERDERIRRSSAAADAKRRPRRR
jgi:hypothetical protein